MPETSINEDSQLRFAKHYVWSDAQNPRVYAVTHTLVPQGSSQKQFRGRVTTPDS